MMRIDVLTLFPEMVDNMLSESIIGRARENNLIDLSFINIRDFTTNKHNKVDDTPYGGGNGMVMQYQPIYDAYLSILENSNEKPYVIYMSPQGRVFNQQIAKEFSKIEHLVILCGHYEGIDERIIEEIVDEEISIGDFVLTGGEIPAAVICDSIIRLLPGVLSADECFEIESHYNGLLEFPQYTRPPEINGKKVPEILLSGHHANIEKWRMEQAIKRTKEKRPDMYEKYIKSNEY